MLFCIARTCVCSYGANQEKKHFLLHELDKKLIRNLYRIYQLNTWKKKLFLLRELPKKPFLLHELDKICACSYCANSKKTFSILHELNEGLVSNLYQTYQLQTSKKKMCFIARTVKTKILFTARTE